MKQKNEAWIVKLLSQTARPPVFNTPGGLAVYGEKKKGIDMRKSDGVQIAGQLMKDLLAFWEFWVKYTKCMSQPFIGPKIKKFAGYTIPT